MNRAYCYRKRTYTNQPEHWAAGGLGGGGPTGSLASAKVTEPEGEAPAWCERPGRGRPNVEVSLLHEAPKHAGMSPSC